MPHPCNLKFLVYSFSFELYPLTHKPVNPQVFGLGKKERKEGAQMMLSYKWIVNYYKDFALSIKLDKGLQHLHRLPFPLYTQYDTDILAA